MTKVPLAASPIAGIHSDGVDLFVHPLDSRYRHAGVTRQDTHVIPACLKRESTVAITYSERGECQYTHWTPAKDMRE